MKTPYDHDNQQFSDMCHMIARQQFYPLVWPDASLKFIDTSLGLGGRSQILDGEMGVDKEVIVLRNGSELRYQIQERFRGPQYETYRDVTVTYMNNHTGHKSEWFKIAAGLFVYGYADDRDNPTRLGETICFFTASLKHAVDQGAVNYTVENNGYKNQDFLCFKFDDLLKVPGLVVYHHVPNKNDSNQRLLKITLPKLHGPVRTGIKNMVLSILDEFQGGTDLYELHYNNILPAKGDGLNITDDLIAKLEKQYRAKVKVYE